MIKKLGWIRIVCICILILGLLGCSNNCSTKSTPDEQTPESTTPTNNGSGTDTITEDSVVPNGPDNESGAQPTVPAGSEEPADPAETEKPDESEASATPGMTPDPLEIDPDDFATPTSGSTQGAATPTPAATPDPDTSESPAPTEDNGPIVLPELP